MARSAHHQQSELALEAWVPEGRRLVLVDLENIVGGSDATLDATRLGIEAFMAAVPANADDVWVWACGVELFSRTVGLVPTRLSLGRGVDGADQLLLAEIEPEVVCGRFASVVLGSGDGRAFTPTVQHLQAMGVPTDVVARPSSTSHSLRSAARSFTPLCFALAA